MRRFFVLCAFGAGDGMKDNFIRQYSVHFSDPPEKIRVASRALIVENNKILLSYETNTGVYMTPGGGAEKDESLEECCIREVREETGYIVSVKSPFVIIDEYCFETMYESNYFICYIIDKSENSLTDVEIEHGMVSRWLDINDALDIFGNYSSKSEDIASLYRRELTVIKEYLKYIKTAL